jgi:elongation factor Ts
MSIGRHAFLELGAASGLVSCYIHSNGKIGVLVELNCEKPENAKKPELLELGKNIAMQVAAANPAALDKESLDPSLVEREREIYRQKTLDEGKPANIVDKIVDGRINKFYQEACLLNQAYIRDDKLSISDVVDACAKTLADKITVRRFIRFQLGEGAPA